VGSRPINCGKNGLSCFYAIKAKALRAQSVMSKLSGYSPLKTALFGYENKIPNNLSFCLCIDVM
jgi:hypothetical protein